MLQSVSTINQIIGEQVDKGISPERIIVGGFSQGGVIALMVTINMLRLPPSLVPFPPHSSSPPE